LLHCRFPILIIIIFFSSQALAMKQASTGGGSQGVSERDFGQAGNAIVIQVPVY
jgi:hypothetical protein